MNSEEASGYARQPVPLQGRSGRVNRWTFAIMMKRLAIRMVFTDYRIQ